MCHFVECHGGWPGFWVASSSGGIGLSEIEWHPFAVDVAEHTLGGTLPLVGSGGRSRLCTQRQAA